MSEEVVEEIPFDSSIIPDSLQRWYELEEIVFNLTDDNVERAIELGSYYIKDSKGLLYNLLLQVSKVRRFSFRLLSVLWSKLGPTSTEYTNTPFLDYLSVKKILDPKNLICTVDKSKSLEIYENAFPIDSIYYTIEVDDLDSFVFKSSEQEIAKMSVSFDVCPDGMSVLSFAAYCGSVKIFKYMVINGFMITKDTLHNGIKGGCEEIIELLSQQFDLNNCFKSAVEYHRNNVAEWLVNNFKCEPVDISFCIRSMNTLALVYEIKNEGYADSYDEFNRTPLINAILQMNVDIVAYLISQGADVECCDLVDKLTPLIIAAQNGNLAIVKCLVENGADIESKSIEQRTPLFDAAKLGFLDIVKYLVENGANIEGKEDAPWTPLLIATFHMRDDVCEYLRAHGANTAAKAKYSRFTGVAKECSHRRKRPR